MSNASEGVEAIQKRYPSPYSPPSIPSPGRFVRYHQFEDGKDWPALILEVKEEEGIDVGVGNPIPTTTICLLQIFRAYANSWRWVPEGTDWGHWSWPERTP